MGEKPAIEQGIDLILPKDQKRVLFADDTIELVNIDGKYTFFPHGCEACCINRVDLRVLSDFLKRNPAYSAEFEVRSNSRGRYKQAVKVLTNDAINDYDIPKEKIYFIYRGVDEEIRELPGKLASVAISFVRR